jgi:hypothetical protein
MAVDILAYWIIQRIFLLVFALVKTSTKEQMN